MFNGTLFSRINKQRRIVAYLDGLPPGGDLRSERVNELPAPVLSGRRLQSELQVELDTLLPSVLDRAFKGEL